MHVRGRGISRAETVCMWEMRAENAFFCLIPSSSIPPLFLILLGKKHSCVVHKYFELKRQTVIGPKVLGTVWKPYYG